MNAPIGNVSSTNARPVRTPGKSAPRDFRGALSTVIFVAGCTGLLLWAWLGRHNGVISPKQGLGYWLGITGASLMALVLLYPLRKRIKFMRNWSILPTWFRWHMIFGILGPVLVIMHSNFGARSTNALVALISMLLVAGSGVVGRYLYVRIHRGLYGAKLEARELLSEAASVRELIGSQLDAPTEWEPRLKRFEAEALDHSTTLFGAIAQNLRLGRLDRRTRKGLLREFDSHLRRDAKQLGLGRSERVKRSKLGRARIERYFAAIRKAGALAVYDRLFALWHVLHLPLIVLLVITALIHIAAVNMY